MVVPISMIFLRINSILRSLKNIANWDHALFCSKLDFLVFTTVNCRAITIFDFNRQITDSPIQVNKRTVNFYHRICISLQAYLVKCYCTTIPPCPDIIWGMVFPQKHLGKWHSPTLPLTYTTVRVYCRVFYVNINDQTFVLINMDENV